MPNHLKIEFGKEQILEQLARILKDKNFSRSKIYGRLLRFLVNASLEEKEIKEVIIGTELFGKDYDPIKFENKVRVYVYHLRKKLDEYYENSARKDEIIFTIEKGQYLVKFSERGKLHSPRKKKKKQITLLSLIIVSMIIVVFLLGNKERNLFWDATIHNSFPSTVLFGDFFTLTGPIITEGRGITRDFTINNRNDFENYIDRNPEMATELHASPQPYLGGHVPHCTREISKIFDQNSIDFSINLISKWDEGNFQSENIVYFGATKCMGILEKVVNNAYPQFQFYPEYLTRKDPITKETTHYKDVVSYTDKISDYTIVGKVTMPAGNQINFFFSDQDCGIISAVEYFTNIDSVNNFYERHELKDHDFIALFNVTGWLRKGYEMEFLLVDKRNT